MRAKVFSAPAESILSKYALYFSSFLEICFLFSFPNLWTIFVDPTNEDPIISSPSSKESPSQSPALSRSFSNSTLFSSCVTPGLLEILLREVSELASIWLRFSLGLLLDFSIFFLCSNGFANFMIFSKGAYYDSSGLLGFT